MISPDSKSTYFPNDHQSFEMLQVPNDQESAGMSASSSMEYTTITTTTTTTTTSDSDAHLNSILCSLSLLKDKVNQVQSMATSVSSSSLALAGMATLIQEIVVTASRMMFNCQQLALTPPPTTTTTTGNNHNNTTLPVIYGYDDDDHQQHTGAIKKSDGQYENGGISTNFLASEAPFYWYNNDTTFNDVAPSSAAKSISEAENYDIIEIDAAELLAKYTHYCQVCGKGFKRDANLRMHMRAHGDEYKSSAALSNPLKKSKDVGENHDNGTDHHDVSQRIIARKYSCPQEGCRWNKKHAKFQPLKSMVCVKNHYKRSHCPKMYICNRCNRKQFSVLSDLRTHEKHCGDLRWRCSCGTTFSRKDKLMGHVALFVGHSPVGLPAAGKLPRNNTLP